MRRDKYILFSADPWNFPHRVAFGVEAAVFEWWKMGRAGQHCIRIADAAGNNYKVDGKKLVRI